MATNNRSKAKSKGASFTLSTNNKPFTPGGSFMDRMPSLPGNNLPGNGGNNKPGGNPGVSGGGGSGGVFFGGGSGGVSGGGSAGVNGGGFSSNKPGNGGSVHNPIGKGPGNGGDVQHPIGKGPSGSNKPAQAEAKERAQNHSKANTNYFNEAMKRHGVSGNADDLKARYDKATAGLDPELAFKALDGGRVWGESDQKRYDELLKQKNGGGSSSGGGMNMNSQTDSSINNSFNKDDHSINDSFNTTDNSINDSYNTTDSYNTNIADSFNTDQSYAVGGDLNQNIGKKGDMNTSIGDYNQFGAGSSIGNDYSVTIGSANAGNGSQRGPGLANMMGAAAYTALNNNQFARSQSQLNGYGRSTGATQEAEKATGSTRRVGALYNLTGMDQNYWNQKSRAQQGFYLGDIFAQRAPDWVMPPAPKKPEDKTEDIADEFDP